MQRLAQLLRDTMKSIAAAAAPGGAAGDGARPPHVHDAAHPAVNDPDGQRAPREMILAHARCAGAPQPKQARGGLGLPAAAERAAGAAAGALRALTAASNAAKAALGAEAGLAPLLQRLADGAGKERLRADARAILGMNLKHQLLHWTAGRKG